MTIRRSVPLAIVLLTVISMLSFVCQSPSSGQPSSKTANLARPDQLTRLYQPFKNIYTFDQFKVFSENAWVTLPGGSSTTVLRYLVATNQGKTIHGAVIAIATSIDGGRNFTTLRYPADQYFSSLRTANQSLANSLTAPLSASSSSLSQSAQGNIALRIGTAITATLRSTPAPANTSSPVVTSTAVPSTPKRPCTTPQPTGSPETIAEIKDEIKLLASAPANLSSQLEKENSDLAFKICEAENGESRGAIQFPISRVVQFTSGNGHMKLGGSITTSFDLRPNPLTLEWKSSAETDLFGVRRDLVSLLATASVAENGKDAIAYQATLGLSPKPVFVGSLTSDNLDATLSDQPQQVLSFSKTSSAVSLGILRLTGSFDISGLISNSFDSYASGQSLYFDMSPSVRASATGNVTLSALVSSARLLGDLTVLDYSGHIAGGAVLFSDPGSTAKSIYLADRYLSTGSGSALSGKLSLEVNLMCPTALKRLLCIKKTFLVHDWPGYSLKQNFLSSDGWEVLSLPVDPVSRTRGGTR